MIIRLMTLLCTVSLLLLNGCDQLPAYFERSTVDRGVTVEPVGTFVFTNRTNDGTLTFLVERVTILEPQTGMTSRLQLNLVVANQGDTSVLITAESFRVRNQSYEFYSARVPETLGLPYLIGASLPPASSLVGIIQVEVPVGAALADLTLVWCLESTCQSPLEVPLTLITSP